MKGHARRRGALLALGVVLAVASAPPTLAASDLSDTSARSFADVAQCAADSDHLVAAIVVDESGSLRLTDPEDERVTAVLTALDALEQLERSSADRLDVQVSLATFGNTYNELVGWGAVSRGHADAVRKAAERELPERDRGNFTDYRVALRGAQQSLNARTAELEGSSCAVTLWFTDGRLDVDGSGGESAANDAARKEICSPQGIADGVRGDGITVVALALFANDGGGAVTQEDQLRLRAIAEGSAGGEECGTVPVPSSSSPGAFLRAENAGALQRLFAQAAALIEGAFPGLSVACPGPECFDGALPIPADAGISRVRIVVEHDPGGRSLLLESPSGTQVELERGESTIDGAQLAVRNREALTTADLSFPGSGSPGGTWTLRSNPDAPTRADVYYFWAGELRLTAPDEIVLGEAATIEVAVVYPDGSTLDLSALGTSELVVQVAGRPVAAHPGPGGVWQVNVTVPLAEAVTSLPVEAELRASTQPTGIPLGPVRASAEFPTKLPASYPSVSPSRLVLPTISGEAGTAAAITVTGAERGTSRVCFGEANTVGPETAGAVTVMVSSPCVEVDAGQAVDVTVSIATDSAADGRIDGSIPVTLEAADDGASIAMDLPFTSSMVRPVDEAKRWALVGALTLGALALAWLTAELARRVSDRFVLGTDARVASVPVEITTAGLRRVDPSSSELLDAAEDFEPIPEITKTKRMPGFSAQGLEFKRSFSWNPLSSGRAWARSRSGAIVASFTRDGILLDPAGERAPVDFPGSTGFVLEVENPSSSGEGGALRGRLVVIIDSPDGRAKVLPGRLEMIGTAPWDRIVEQVTAAAAHRGEQGTSTEPKSARRGEPARPTGAPPHPEPGQGTENRPRTMLDETPTTEDDGPPAPTISWTTASSESPTLPPASSGKPGRAPRPPRLGRKKDKDRGARDDRPRPAPDEGQDPPAPSINFWD